MGEPWPRAGLAHFLPFGATPVPTAMAAAPPHDAAAALQLYAQVLAAAGLADAAHRLVARLALDRHLSRATLGLHQAGRTSLLASSHLDLTQPQSDLRQRLIGAMDEAIEQAQSLAWPPAEADAPDAATPIDVELRLLQQAQGGCVAVLPLGRDGQPFAALCVERERGPAFSRADIEQLDALLSLALPALRWMHQGSLPWHRRAWADARHAMADWRRPERRARRRLVAAAALALAFVALAPLEHTVSGRARVEGAEQRVLAAPTDGFVGSAHVRPGDRVKAGAPLVDLLEGDLRLERERWGSQLAQHENAYAAAMARADRTLAAVSLARADEAQSQLALVDEQLSRGRVVAPFDALVIQGDLSQSIGAPVRQGDTLLTLATLDRHRVIVEVDETDIARVQPGQAGRLSLSSLPWGGEAVVVERIAPLAKAVEGRNVFEVQARLVAPNAALRPGLLGRAALAVDRTPPLWVWLRHAANRLRVVWWSWVA
ncbi:MAG: efflux RND transporter periplasmic adaptor subunit [Rubrivivax sp.]|nr:efflux RND transporter periplasmic adaptor subunit [Rubrivivax sp.]